MIACKVLVNSVLQVLRVRVLSVLAFLSTICPIELFRPSSWPQYSQHYPVVNEYYGLNGAHAGCACDTAVAGDETESGTDCEDKTLLHAALLDEKYHLCCGATLVPDTHLQFSFGHREPAERVFMCF